MNYVVLEKNQDKNTCDFSVTKLKKYFGPANF